MTQAIQVQSRVGEDGVLALNVPLGSSEANADVLVTIEPLIKEVSAGTESERISLREF